MKLQLRVTAFFIFSSILCGSGCLAESPADQNQGQPQAADNSEYKEIFRFYTGGEYEVALKRLSSFERMYPTSKIMASIENLHGMTYLLMRQPAQGIVHFKKAAEIARAQPNFSQFVLYNLATAQFEAGIASGQASGMLDDAHDTASDIRPEYLDRDTQIKFHYLLARIHERRQLPLEAVHECIVATTMLTPAEIQEGRHNIGAFSNLMELALGQISSVPTLESLYKKNEHMALTDLLLFRLANIQVKQGERAKALENFKLLSQQFPKSSKAPLANQFLSADQNSNLTEKNVVGVLLPLRGKFGHFGERTLEAIELSLGVFGPGTKEGPGKENVTLAIEDSGEDADQAIAALEKLVNEHHAIVVIGPLLSKGIDQVTQRAQELAVPLISLARASSSTALGNYVFQGGITLQMQAEQIARYARQKLGFTRFAEIYPSDKVGIETGNLFWDAIEGLGAEMVGAESYPAGETDFRHVVDKLSGLYYTEARQRELDQLAKQRQLNNIRKRTRKTEQYFSLKPIVDYQAVFIPEEPKVSGQILPTFAYRDVDHVRFLGIAAWNSPELASRAQKSAEGSLFTDAFYAESPASESRQFVDAFRTTFDSDPTSMEAIAYDAGSLVHHVLLQNSATRAEVKDHLQAIKNFPGVTGRINYSNGLFNRNLKVLTIRGGAIAEAE